MNPKLRAFLVANGLRHDAPDTEAWELYDKLKTDGVEIPGLDPGTRSAAGAANPAAPAAPGAPHVPAITPADVEAAAARAVQADIFRRREIEDRLAVAGLASHNNGEFARTLLDNPEITVDRAASLIFAELKARNIPIGAGAHGSQIHVGVEAGEKLRAAVTDGLILSCGHRLEKPAAGAGEFRTMSLLDICRTVLEAQGVNTRGMGRRDIAGRAMASASTSDLPYIFSAVVNKNLLAAYQEAPATWRPIVAVTSAMDFKTMYAIKLSGAPDLQSMNENGEYKTASFSDSAETYRVVTKGRRVVFTREMIINDDRRALSRIPQLFGNAARRMEADAVYSLITTNGNMSDGVALFHSTHKNLAGTGAALAADALGVARAAMRLQTGLAGELLDIIPEILLVPVALETTAEVLLRSAALPNAEMSSGVHNPWAGRLTPVAEPRLDAADANAWFLFASPNVAPVIEVAYLEGEEQPYVDQQVDFNSDAMIIKVRHDFGAGVVDHVGGYKNAGPS
jgi:hypothetical protein